MQHLKGFYKEIAEDPTITISGICLYQCLLFLCSKNSNTNKALINRREVEQMLKISRSTYQKALKELQVRGYIEYTPSFNPLLGSLVEFHDFPQTVLTIKVHKHEILFTAR